MQINYFLQMFPAYCCYNFPVLNQEHFYMPQEPMQYQAVQNYREESPQEQKKQEVRVKVEEQSDSPYHHFQQPGNNDLEVAKSELMKRSYQVTKTLWNEKEDRTLVDCVDNYQMSWKQISKLLPNRNPKMCYNRYKRLSQRKKNLWSEREDALLKELVQVKKMKWRDIEGYFNNRKAKQLRERYINFARPQISREPWTIEEDLQIIQLTGQHGKKWKLLESYIKNRSENQIKNRFYGRLQGKISSLNMQ